MQNCFSRHAALCGVVDESQYERRESNDADTRYLAPTFQRFSAMVGFNCPLSDGCESKLAKAESLAYLGIPTDLNSVGLEVPNGIVRRLGSKT